jgi:hypothetical protein
VCSIPKESSSNLTANHLLGQPGWYELEACTDQLIYVLIKERKLILIKCYSQQRESRELRALSQRQLEPQTGIIVRLHSESAYHRERSDCTCKYTSTDSHRTATCQLQPLLSIGSIVPQCSWHTHKAWDRDALIQLQSCR